MMPVYAITMTREAREDIARTYRYIAFEVMQPETAGKYIRGVYDVIRKLAWLGGSFAVSQRGYIQKLYGPGARTVRYKRVTVVYNIIDDVVLIRRVMASGLVL